MDRLIQKEVVRPQLGDKFLLYAVLQKRRNPMIFDPKFPRIERWNRIWEFIYLDHPIEAVYIGYRTLYEGTREFIEDTGYVFTPSFHFEAWMFVFDPRKNPVMTTDIQVVKL